MFAWLAPHHTHDSPVLMKLLWTGDWFLSWVTEQSKAAGPQTEFSSIFMCETGQVNWSHKSYKYRYKVSSLVSFLFLWPSNWNPRLAPKEVELIVNLRRNCRFLFTMCQTSKHLILALLTILQYSVQVPCTRAVTCNTCYSWWAHHEMLWVIKVENLRWHRLLMFCEMLQVNLQLAFKLNNSPK